MVELTNCDPLRNNRFSIEGAAPILSARLIVTLKYLTADPLGV